MAREYEKQLVRDAARRYGIDEAIALAQIQAESSFNPNAQSKPTKYGTAKGLAQFIDPTAKQYGLTNPFDPVAAADAYARYMRDLLQQFGGDYRKALAAYNAGPGNVRKYNGVPPFTETQNYVKKILANAGQSDAASPSPSSSGNQGEWGAKEMVVIGFVAVAVLMTVRG